MEVLSNLWQAMQAAIDAHPEVVQHLTTFGHWVREHATAESVTQLVGGLRSLDWLHSKWSQYQAKQAPPATAAAMPGPVAPAQPGGQPCGDSGVPAPAAAPDTAAVR